jgi:hypothetical protein
VPHDSEANNRSETLNATIVHEPNDGGGAPNDTRIQEPRDRTETLSATIIHESDVAVQGGTATLNATAVHESNDGPRQGTEALVATIIVPV